MAQPARRFGDRTVFERVGRFDNLREIGLGVRVYSSKQASQNEKQSHREKFHWRSPYNTQGKRFEN